MEIKVTMTKNKSEKYKEPLFELIVNGHSKGEFNSILIDVKDDKYEVIEFLRM